MKRFRSSLTTLARLRAEQRRERELALARAQEALTAAQRGAELLQDRRDSELATAMSTLRQGTTAAQLLAWQTCDDQLQQAITNQQTVVAQQRQQVRSSVDHLQAAVAETAVLDRLLNERRRLHRRNVLKQEQLNLDEHSTRRRLAVRAVDGGEY
ncbi:MAG: flagellar export protein FliJ [Planctomycetaceae bacterium]